MNTENLTKRFNSTLRLTMPLENVTTGATASYFIPKLKLYVYIITVPFNDDIKDKSYSLFYQVMVIYCL